MSTAGNHPNRTSSKRKKELPPLRLLPPGFKPGRNDILCGRGNVFSNHEGNRSFNKIIHLSLRDYWDAPDRAAKAQVVETTLRFLRISGNRFVKAVVDGTDKRKERWYELTESQAHQKIGHAIRDTIRLLRDRSNKIAKTAATKDFPIVPSMQLQSPIGTMHVTTTPSNVPQMGIEFVGWLRDDRGNSERTEKKSYSFIKTNESFDANSDDYIPLPFCDLEQSSSLGPFLLDNEYPEEGFDFSPNSFFGDVRILYRAMERPL